MAELVPSRKKGESAGNGGTLAMFRDFPAVVRRMQSEFDELFERFAREWPIAAGGFGKGWHWGINAEDKDDRVVVRAEAPGFEAGDFDVRVSSDRLVLRAAKKAETKKEGGEYREQFECYESVTLPPGIDKDKIEAVYHNGVLTVTIPKTKEGQGKKIAVKST